MAMDGRMRHQEKVRPCCVLWAERLSTMMCISRRRGWVSTTVCRKPTNAALVCRATVWPIARPSAC